MPGARALRLADRQDGCVFDSVAAPPWTDGELSTDGRALPPMSGRRYLLMPWPPSVNHYYRNIRGVTKISRAGREYVAAVARRLIPRKAFAGRIAVGIQAVLPDNRRRDIDNVLKVALDSLTKAGVFLDDSQIEWLSIAKLKPSSTAPGGQLMVTVTEHG